MIYPIANIDAVISSPFGNRVNPTTGASHFHNGIDIAVPVETPIYAIEDGYIENILDNAVGGSQVILRHSNGYRSGFAHLNRRLKPKGASVKKGELVAYSGNTGNTTGPHIHYTLKNASNEYVDPSQVRYTGGKMGVWSTRKKVIVASSLALLLMGVGAAAVAIKKYA